MPILGRDEQPQGKPPFVSMSSGWSANAGYGIKANHTPYDFNLLEVELQYDLYLHPQHALTLSLAVSGGGDNNDRWVMRDDDRVAFSDNYHHLMLTLMGGYRFTQPITKHLELELGAKGGVCAHRLEVDYGRDWSDDSYKYDSDRDVWEKKYHHGTSRSASAVGTGYTCYAGLTCKPSPKYRLALGYALRGTTTQPKSRRGSSASRINPMRWHVIRLGITTIF